MNLVLEMSLTQNEVKGCVLHIINKISKERGDFLLFNLNKFIESWDGRYCKFKGLGFGKVKAFLLGVCSVEDLGGHDLRLRKQLLCLKNNKQVDALLVQRKLKLEREEQCRPTITGDTSGKQATLLDLKYKVLSMIHRFIKNKEESREYYSVPLEELSQQWQSISPTVGFKKHGFGTFEKFLFVHCNLRKKKRNKELLICLQDIEDLLETVKADKDVHGERTSEKYLSDSSSSGLEIVKAEQANSGKDEGIKLNEPAVKNVSKVDATDNMDSIILEQGTSLCTPSIGCQASDATPLVHDEQTSEKEQYLPQFTILLRSLGLKGLRKLFMEIYPNWSNTEDCVNDFKKGSLKLEQNQLQMFQTGDINQWDITLLASVLLYAKVARDMLKKDPTKIEAIKIIRKLKNNFISHNTSNEMTETEFVDGSQDFKNAILALGFTEEEFQEEKKRAELPMNRRYYAISEEEMKDFKEGVSDLKKYKSDVEIILSKIHHGDIKQSEIPQQVKKPEWDQWLKVKELLRNLDADKNQYILIVDKMQSPDVDHAKILANMRWKLIFDLDPNSDIDGLFTKFTPGMTDGGIMETYAPSNLEDAAVDILVDTKRMQWLFVNGRNLESTMADEESLQRHNKDNPKDSLCDWEISFKTPVQDFVRSFCDQLDKMKPIVCIIFKIRNGISIQIAENIVWDLHCRLHSKKFSSSFVSFTSNLKIDKMPNLHTTPLSQNLFLVGLSSILGVSSQERKLPTSQEDLYFSPNLTEYSFLKEHLEVLYKGCEEIPVELPEKEREDFENEHLKKFLTGNAITFPSLHYRHDATRQITSDICHHIIEVPNIFSAPQIVQITHAPGSGGTTIARRVLWDLHLKIPCAIVRTKLVSESCVDEEKHVNSLCKGITLLARMCEKSPVVLVDGSSRLARSLSESIVRNLEDKAIILRCANYRETSELENMYFHIKSKFDVNPDLKKNEADYSEFRIKYDEYCKRFPRRDFNGKEAPRDRVFHFPMMAMLGEFHKLEKIIKESLDILKRGVTAQYEIAILVAFLQHYAGFATPASFIGKYLNTLKTESQTYEDVAENFSETLVNLMVPEKALNKQKYIASVFSNRKYVRGDECLNKEPGYESASLTSKRASESYTFQHPKIATLVIEHSGQSIGQITQCFVDTKILEIHRETNENKSLIDHLFLYKKDNSDERFSLLVEELSKDESNDRILEEVAIQTKDAAFFSHVARLYACRRNNFIKARNLIKEGLEVDKNASIDRRRGVYSAEGFIVLKEMVFKKNTCIKNMDGLKTFSKEALDLFRNAKDSPPRLFPNPLIGEVKVWLFCFQYIKDQEPSSDDAISLILGDDFFRNSISECVALFVELEEMVENVPLNDPAHTRELIKENKLNFTQILGQPNKKDKKTPQICRDICSNYKTVASEEEIIRLEVLGQRDEGFWKLDYSERESLFASLRKLVVDYNRWDHARDLMDVAAIQQKPPFPTNYVLSIVEKWTRNMPKDRYSHFYKYILNFLGVCCGKLPKCLTDYTDALKASKQNLGNKKRNYLKYYVGKEGERGSICTILSNPVLVAKYMKERKSKEESCGGALDLLFWKEHCREYLFEFQGRIIYPGRNKTYTPHIEMNPGNLKVSISKSLTDEQYIDYRHDARVNFVICFTLAGPIAKDIRSANGEKLSNNGKSKK